MNSDLFITNYSVIEKVFEHMLDSPHCGLCEIVNRDETVYGPYANEKKAIDAVQRMKSKRKKDGWEPTHFYCTHDAERANNLLCDMKGHYLIYRIRENASPRAQNL